MKKIILYYVIGIIVCVLCFSVLDFLRFIGLVGIDTCMVSAYIATRTVGWLFEK